MREEQPSTAGRATDPASGAPRARAGSPAPWQAPRFEVIPLDCEISAYAPAGDDPLF